MRAMFVVSSAALVAWACSSSKSTGPSPVEVYSTGVPGEAAATSTRTMTATVLAVDAVSRKLTLRDQEGQSETIDVPPGVKRLNEIAAGDVIDVQVQEGLFLQYQPAGDAYVPPSATLAGARAPATERPGGAVGGGVQGTVVVTAIDLETRIVGFQDLDGYKYQVKAGPGLAIDKLTVGDRLLATYVTRIAIAVEKRP